MKGPKLTSVSLCLILFLALSGCDRDKSGDNNTPVITENSSPGVSLRILPENPTTLDDLYVLVGGEALTAQIQWQVNDNPVESAESTRLSRDFFRKGDQVTVFLFADGRTARTQVEISNSAPEVMGVALKPREFYRGIDVTVFPEAFDPDDDPVFFSLQWSINGEEMPEIGRTLSGDLFQRGDRLSLKVIPSDGDLEGPLYQTGDVMVPNAPPRFVTVPPAMFKSKAYSYTAQAEDPDGDFLTYTLVVSPPGMQIDGASGYILWPLEQAPAGEHLVLVTVEDSHGGRDTQEFRLDLLPGEQ